VTPAATLDHLVEVDTIYAEPGVEDLPRGAEVLARFPGATRVPVGSHWQIPGLHGNPGNVADWNRIKRTTLVLGTLKSPRIRPNGRSSDFIAPSLANGCAMSCAYCYVPRRKGFANPISVFANAEQITRALERHVARQGVKATPNQCDPHAWVYDIGENSDCSVDHAVSDNVADLVALFRDLPAAKASFATKYVNRDLLALDPRGRTRVRFSLMPHAMSRLVDVRTSPVAERIAAIDDFVSAGYEVPGGLRPLQPLADAPGSPPCHTGGDRCAHRPRSVHTRRVNLGWHPKAEDVLWRPDLQEQKISQTGGLNVRYRTGKKGRMVQAFRDLVAERLPECEIRYAF